MTEKEDYGMRTLLHAVIHEPWKVKEIVAADPSIVDAKNVVGENALRYCALENMLEEVSLLRSLGSSIQAETVYESIDAGHTRMVALLLELGADPEVRYCRFALRNSTLSKREKHIIKDHLKAYGYEVIMNTPDG